MPVLIPTRATRDARYVRVPGPQLIHRMHVLDYNSAGPQQEAGGHPEHGAQTGGALPFTPLWRSVAHRLMSDLAAGGIRLEMPVLFHWIVYESRAHAALDSVPLELLGDDDTDDDQMPELEPDPMAQTG